MVNIDTSKSRYVKRKNEALLKPFYFQFYVPANSAYAFLILERIGHIGIANVLSNALQRFWTDQGIGTEYAIAMNPVSLRQVLDEKLEQLKNHVKKIEFRQVRRDDLKISRLAGCPIPDGNASVNITYTALHTHRFFLGNFIDNFLGKKPDSNLYVLNEGLTCSDIAFTVSLDGKERILFIRNMPSFGMNVDVSCHVELGPNRYPTFASLDKEANRLISYIMAQYGLSS